MRRSESSRASGEDRPILPWKFVVGALLHCIVPAWLVTVATAWLLSPPASDMLHGLLDAALDASGPFLLAYIALTLFAALGALALDPLLRRRRSRRVARDPAAAARRSREQLRLAAAQARGALGDAAAARVDALEHAAWDHQDPRYQALAQDLAAVVRTSTRALESAPTERRPELVDLANASLQQLSAALASLNTERGRLDEGDARTLARYVDSRYGASDFASGQDR